MYIDSAAASETALKKYLGRKSSNLKIGTDKGSYNVVVATTTSVWYAVYQFSDNDTAGLKTKLLAKVSTADIYGSMDGTAFTYPATETSTYVALRVR